MKISILLPLVLSILNISVLSQDLIYEKNYSIQRAKILEVGIEIIRYKKFEIPQGPTFELLKSNVYKIRYENGFEEIYDKNFRPMSEFKVFNAPLNDTSGYSMVYIAFHFGDDASNTFPLYFNGKYIWTLKNHTRISCKLFSEGPLIIERRVNNKNGPKINLYLQHGKSYGISIQIPHPYATNPNKKFSLTLFDEEGGIHDFLNDDFYSFEPFRNEEMSFEEDKKAPVIHY